MKKSIKHKPLTDEEYKMVKGQSKICDIILYTGVRIAELKKLIDKYQGQSYLDIKTKKSGDSTNRIYLVKEAQDLLWKSIGFRGVSVKTLYREVKKVSERLGIDFSPHNLRASFATRLLSNGVDVVSVQHLMNHSDVSQTAQYIRFDEKKLREGLNTLTELNTIEGMTPQEMRQEILKLRKRIKRLEEKIN